MYRTTVMENLKCLLKKIQIKKLIIKIKRDERITFEF